MFFQNKKIITIKVRLMVHLGERDGALMQIGKQWRSFFSADNVLVLDQIRISVFTII